MESWAIWSIVVVLFGMAGFWGGLLQHAHLSSNDGGILTVYAKVIGRSTVGTDIVNTVTPNDINFIIIGGTFGTQRLLRVTILGDWLQNTAAPQQPVRVDVLYGGVLAANFIDVGTQAISVNRYIWKMVLEIVALNATNSQQCFALFSMILSTGNTLSVNLFNQVGGRDNGALNGTFAVDTTIDQTFTVRHTNAMADPNYKSRVNSVTIEQF